VSTPLASAEPLSQEALDRLRAPDIDPSAVDVSDQKAPWEQVLLVVFIAVPFLAVAVAVPIAWGGFLGWSDIVLLLGFFALTSLGITVGFHRYFTHGAFKAVRGLRVALAIIGSLAIEGPVSRWVADHRKHHAFSDKEGDPHSPWRYGPGIWSLSKGLFYAHMGWLFDVEQTPLARYVPDLIEDRDITRVSRAFPALVAVSLISPAVLGALMTWSWQGAVTGFFWGSLVRIALVHHVTWSINSICHVFGEKPFRSRDKAGNVWWLAIPSMGESWHNLHHADPTCARHGVEKGQIDASARVIRWFEMAGWVYEVRWPKAQRLDARRSSA
jgi:stearoyl-CoA desaturase (delta-9 desaturase)